MKTIKFTSDRYPNTHLEIINDQTWVRVSINISPELQGLLPRGNVFKAKQLTVFMISARIKGQLTTDKVDAAYKNCMATAMMKVREAKRINLQKEILNLQRNEQPQLQISFSA